MKKLPTISAKDAAQLLLAAQGLRDDPERRATLLSVERLIRSMGFVQIDTINVVERAHHLILATRLDGYRQHMLHDLLEKRRALFEHWTHDASAIPVELFPHWRHRFARYLQRAKTSAWWRERLGRTPAKTIAHVRDRIEREGPLLSRDFEHDGAGHPISEKGWWGWKPHKVALEHLWRSGELAIARRIGFQKQYDLTHRVLERVHDIDPPDRSAHIDWACASALERLGLATPSELAAFWYAIDLSEARAWCRSAEGDGRIVRVLVESRDGTKPHESFALPDWQLRLRNAPASPRIRLLCPFDPVVRDRRRAARLFGFDYRFEAFVPEPQRKYGYYVMPIMEDDRFTGRLDPKFDRGTGTLEIRGLWWEQGVKLTRSRRAALDEALARLAAFIGADRVQLPPRRR
jgi:uncharacterized protein